MKTLIDDRNISDNRLLMFLQKKIQEISPNNPLLKKFHLCGAQRVITAPAIFLLNNGEKAHYYGLARCHSSWGCPVCTAKKMAEYGTRIAAAIDALKIRYNMSAFMMTFTIPHAKWMSIRDSYEILQNTWRAFTRGSRRAKYRQVYTLKKNVGEDGRAVGKAGEQKIYMKNYRAPFTTMINELGITHNVRVYEFTWSPKHGWHPHIHSLWWLPDKNFDKLNDDWEGRLLEDWWRIARRETVRYFNKKFPDQDEENESIVDDIYIDWRKYPKTGHRSVFFSKDKNGKVRRIESSHYISGWGGDTELTHQRKEKHAADGHFTPHEILQKAYDNPNDPQWIYLYLDYLKITFGHRRIMFSPKTGLNKIALDWMKTNEWAEVLKKKFTDKDAAKPWKVVAWFSDEQWQEITFLELQTKLLEMSFMPDARQEIKDFLLQFNIRLSAEKHYYEKVFEKEDNSYAYVLQNMAQ